MTGASSGKRVMLMSPLLVLIVMLMSSMSFEESRLLAVFKELVDE